MKAKENQTISYIEFCKETITKNLPRYQGFIQPQLLPTILADAIMREIITDDETELATEYINHWWEDITRLSQALGSDDIKYLTETDHAENFESDPVEDLYNIIEIGIATLLETTAGINLKNGNRWRETKDLLILNRHPDITAFCKAVEGLESFVQPVQESIPEPAEGNTESAPDSEAQEDEEPRAKLEKFLSGKNTIPYFDMRKAMEDSGYSLESGPITKDGLPPGRKLVMDTATELGYVIIGIHGNNVFEIPEQNTGVFEGNTITERELIYCLKDEGYDVYDNMYDLEGRSIDAGKAAKIAEANGFVPFRVSSAMHNDGRIYFKNTEQGKKLAFAADDFLKELSASGIDASGIVRSLLTKTKCP